MDAPIQFCTTADGVRIAYMVSGEGPPLVRVSGWVSHLELDRELASPWMRTGVVPGFQVVRFDKRGTGLSDRGITDFSIETRLRDLEAVIDALKLKKFYLVGISEGGPIAMTYAAQFPRRVIKLALYGTLAFGGGETPASNALAGLVRAEWGMGSDAMSGMFAPGATAEERQHSARYQRESARPEEAALMIEAIQRVDVRPLLSQIKAPTVVVHVKGDKAIPFSAGRDIAGSIRGANLVSIEGDRHAPDEASLAQINEAMRRFFTGEDAAPAKATPAAPAQDGSVTVMFTDVEGSTALTDRLGDERARAVLKAHERITREALTAHGGSEIKTMGDGFMASFPSATRALQCAIAIQRAFAAHNDAGAGDPIRVRIGLNAGEPITEDGDLFGTAVNMAARVAGKANGGEILASNVVRELTAGKEFMFSDRGDSALRGFEEAVRLYEVRWQDVPG